MAVFGQGGALERFGLRLQGPEAQKQLQIQQLISQLGSVPSEGMGPQQPMDTKSFLTQLAGVTGDAGSLANFLIAEEKQKADQQRQQQIASVLGGPPLQNMATAGAASGPNPLSVRNNNPGNMRPVGGNEGFQSFETPEAGLQAMANDLRLKINGQSQAMKGKFGPNYQPTLRNVISTWAPPGENDTQAYINAVSQKTGIPADKPLTEADIARIQPAMIEQEGGSAASEYFGGQESPSALQSFSGVQETQEPEVLSQLAKLAQIDPDTYGDDYLSAKASYESDRIKERRDAEKAVKEDTKALTEGEGTLRKEFEGLPDVKQFRDVEGAYQRVLKATQNPTAAGDIAIVFNFMKMLDPGSTVREGEFATAASAAGVPDRIKQMYNKLMEGERLAPDQRQDFLNQAGGQYQAAEELFNVRADQYENLASSYKYEPKRIVTRARGKMPAKAPSGLDPAIWDHMTPEEKKLFQ